jgi:type VI secretion system VasD/TssJ family lipoprotein
MACVKRLLDGRGGGFRWVSAFAALLAFGCAHAPRPPCENPPPVYVVLKGSDRLNPDEKGRPLVTQVLILQVKGTAKLEGAEFGELTTKPKEIPGDELLSMNETTVEPSGTTTVGYRRDPKATAVVVVANFRQPSGFSWRATAKLPPVDVEKCPDQPVAPKDAPTATDTVLTFSLEDVRVVNRTPPSKDDGK